MKEKESKCGTFNNNILCLHGDWSQNLKYTTCGLRRVNDNTHRYVSIFISHIYTHFVKKQHGRGKQITRHGSAAAHSTTMTSTAITTADVEH